MKILENNRAECLGRLRKRDKNSEGRCHSRDKKGLEGSISLDFTLYLDNDGTNAYASKRVSGERLGIASVCRRRRVWSSLSAIQAPVQGFTTADIKHVQCSFSDALCTARRIRVSITQLHALHLFLQDRVLDVELLPRRERQLVVHLVTVVRHASGTGDAREHRVRDLCEHDGRVARGEHAWRGGGVERRIRGDVAAEGTVREREFELTD